MPAEKSHKPPVPVVYPDSDGQPMADNTLQFEWIAKLKGALEYLFFDEPEVFVAGNLLWYAVEGAPAERQALDVMVVWGRPKGYRGSYKQWEEGGIPPQVVMEVLSPDIPYSEILRKQVFYNLHGVEEYCLLVPEEKALFVFLRKDGKFTLSSADLPERRWTSPRLGLSFAIEADELRAYLPNGELVLPYQEMQKKLEARAQAAETRLAELEAELKRLQGER